MTRRKLSQKEKAAQLQKQLLELLANQPIDDATLIEMSSACLTGPMPSPDHAVELQNLRFNPMELIAKR